MTKRMCKLTYESFFFIKLDVCKIRIASAMPMTADCAVLFIALVNAIGSRVYGAA